MSKKKKENRHDRFKIINKDCGHGARSKVSIVKRKSDGKLLIWKQPLFDDRWHHESLRKEIKRAKLWRKFGISRVKVCWHPDKRSLLKTYIKGDTLEQILTKNPGFFSEKSRYLKTLRELLGLLINSKIYIYDLIGENLIFDGKRWHVIDSGSVRNRETRSETKQEYRQEFLKSWSKGLPEDEINSLKSFLDSLKPIKK
jgi:tRNA A-37 threonylcarbamoyl transferase component Bud32